MIRHQEHIQIPPGSTVRIGQPRVAHQLTSGPKQLKSMAVHATGERCSRKKEQREHALAPQKSSAQHEQPCQPHPPGTSTPPIVPGVVDVVRDAVPIPVLLAFLGIFVAIPI